MRLLHEVTGGHVRLLHEVTGGHVRLLHEVTGGHVRLLHEVTGGHVRLLHEVTGGHVRLLHEVTGVMWDRRLWGVRGDHRRIRFISSWWLPAKQGSNCKAFCGNEEDCNHQWSLSGWRLGGQ